MTSLQNLHTLIIHSADSYSLSLPPQITIGEIAAYFSQIEPYVRTATLELAYPVRTSLRLQDIGFGAGDRLALMTQAPRQVDLPMQARHGETNLKFRRGTFEIVIHNKKGILLGKPGEGGPLPDVDLRHFIAPGTEDYLSRGCVWVQWDEAAKTWMLSRIGETRVLVDEFDLAAHRLPLAGTRKLRFFPPPNTRDFPVDRQIGDMDISVGAAMPATDAPMLANGPFRVRLTLGAERESQYLRATNNVIMGQVASSLSLQNGYPLNAATRLHLLRLVPPHITLQDLNPNAEMFLYAPRSLTLARNLLVLRDVYRRERAYVLTAGTEDDEKIIGCRPTNVITDHTLDIDLYDTLLAHTKNPESLQTIARYQARIVYKSSENCWWFRPDDPAHMPVSINQNRVGINQAVRLTAGDVLSFAYGPNQFVRLEVDLTSRKD